MEVMDMSLDKFYKMLYENSQTIPEDILGKIAVAVSTNTIVCRADIIRWMFIVINLHICCRLAVVDFVTLFVNLWNNSQFDI